MRIKKYLQNFLSLTSCLSLVLLSTVLHAQPEQGQRQGPPPPPAPLAGPGFVVTYLEAPPAKAAALTADLKAYAAELEKTSAKPAVTLLKELGRPNLMVVVEQWASITNSSNADAESLLAAKVQAEVIAPIDRRVNHPLTPALPDIPATAFVMAMHVDIRGAAGDAAKTLQAQRDAVLAAPGALGYEAGVQDQRNNHFTVSEVWTSRAAYEAYTETAPAKGLRQYLANLIGAPFDDRFYARAGK